MILELVFASISYHPFFNDEFSQRFENKIADNGRLITSPIMGIKITKPLDKYYGSLAIFKGENSVGGPIHGIIGSYGFQVSKNLQVGVAAGTYHQDRKPFKDRKLNSPHPFMPIGGAELVYKIPIKKIYSVSINNLINPLLTNHSISLGVEF